MLLVLIGLIWRTRRSRPKASQASNPIPLWRRWHPGNTTRCDCCQTEAAQLVASRPKLPVEPWSMRRSKRGRKKCVDSADHRKNDPRSARLWLARAATQAMRVDSDNDSLLAGRRAHAPATRGRDRPRCSPDRHGLTDPIERNRSLATHPARGLISIRIRGQKRLEGALCAIARLWP